jgi:hypothetical protein
MDNPCRKRRREEKSFCNSLNASQYEEDLPGPLGEASTTIFQLPSTTNPSSSSSSSSQSKSLGVISPGSSFRDYYNHNLQSRVMMLENQLGTALEELHKLRDSFQCLPNTPQTQTQTQAHTSLSITPTPSTSLQISLGSSNSSTTPTTLSASIPAPPRTNKGSEVVELDIGGTKFKTFRSTLCQNSSTMLARLFDPDSLFNLPREVDGAVFIDRSPKHFPAILAYLRSGRMELPKNLEEIIEFEHECEFYGIPFPEDAFLKYPDCYTLEKVIHLPSSLPKVKEARKNFVMACADKGWGCGMINIFTGAHDETSNFPMNDLFREEPKGVFSRGFIVSDNGHPCVWYSSFSRLPLPFSSPPCTSIFLHY